MERREVLLALAGAGATLALEGCNNSSSGSNELTDADFERLLRLMAGVELKPGQAAEARKILATIRFKGSIDPRVQPSMVFDPEVDLG